MKRNRVNMWVKLKTEYKLGKLCVLSGKVVYEQRERKRERERERERERWVERQGDLLIDKHQLINTYMTFYLVSCPSRKQEKQRKSMAS